MNVTNCVECGQATEDADRVTYYNEKREITKVLHSECDLQVDARQFLASGRLLSRLTLAASLKVMRAREESCASVYFDIDRANKRIYKNVKRFEIEAWFGGVSSTLVETKYEGKELSYPRIAPSLQTTCEDSKVRTIEAKVPGGMQPYVTVTLQEMAGRAFVEIEDPAARITLITATREQTARMGVQGVDGTEEQLHALIDVARRSWKVLEFKPVAGGL